MALQPGLIYAYAQEIRGADRWLIAFSARKVADEWWRAVSDSVTADYRHYEGVERVSMQWYNYNGKGGAIWNTISDDRCASRFEGQVKFIYLKDKNGRELPITVPVVNYADHKSGQRFFIRSVLQPNLFWYYNPARPQIRTSTSERTAFFINIVGGQGNDAKIMIGSDKVSISDEQGNNLIVGQCGAEFNFSDFDGRFRRQSVDSGDMVITQDPLGERWELVF